MVLSKQAKYSLVNPDLPVLHDSSELRKLLKFYIKRSRVKYSTVDLMQDPLVTYI